MRGAFGRNRSNGYHSRGAGEARYSPTSYPALTRRTPAIIVATPHPSATNRGPRTAPALRSPTSGLRKRIKSSRAYWCVKRFLKRVTGREIWVWRDLRIATSACDDWQYAAAVLPPGATVYSFGVGDDIRFETELIERHGATVHGFDPTPTALRWLETRPVPAGFLFHPWAAAGTDGSLTLYPRAKRRTSKSATMWTSDPAQADGARAIDVPAYTMPSIMRKLGHEHIDLVKMDIEGAEYDAIEAMLRLSRLPDQLLVEFHHRFPGIGKQKTLDCLARLRAAGYKLFAISRTGRELGFIAATAANSKYLAPAG
jgi:FkbM family methyltransferase